MFLPQWRLSVRNLVNAITKQSQQKQRQFILKRYVAEYLRYRPLLETAPVREAIEKMRLPGYPYCHPEEGDLLYLLLQEIEGEACLEMGFHTGSTALYMSNAVAARDGRVTSVCLDVGKDATRGKNYYPTTVSRRGTALYKSTVIARYQSFSSQMRSLILFLWMAGRP